MLEDRFMELQPIIKEIEALKRKLDEVVQQYKWALESEDHQIADRDKVLSYEEVKEAEQRREASLLHLKKVKRQIQNAIREALDEARLKRD